MTLKSIVQRVHTENRTHVLNCLARTKIEN